MKQGDFTGLANKYSENRPDYSKTVLKSLIGILDKPIGEVNFLDV